MPNKKRWVKMPVVLVDNVKYSSITYIQEVPAGEEGLKKLTHVPVEVEEQGYCINLRVVTDVVPHIQESETLTAYLIEIRDMHGKLVKRFKPFKQLEFRIGRFYYINEWVKAIAFSEEQSSELNIGDNYKVAILLTRHNTKPLLPFEIKPVGYDAEKIVENLSNIEKSLITLVVEHSTLNKAIGYLYDSYTRLEENDVEGARTAVRNSLQVLRDEFLPEVIVTEEVERLSGEDERTN